MDAATVGAFLNGFLRIVPLIIQLTNKNTDNVCAYEKNIYVPQNGENFDYIVVGAGSAGSIMAGRLTEIENWNILLMEAGDTPHPMLYVPGFFRSYIGIARLIDWGYRMQPQEGVISSYVPNNQPGYTRGKLIGGCSAVHGMHIAKGSPRDYDQWLTRGNEGWGFDDMLPYLKKFETYSGPALSAEDEPFHGTDGPLTVTYKDPATFNEYQELAVASAQALGYDYVDYNGASQIGISVPPFHIRDGERVSAADAYVRPHLDTRSNLKLFKQVFVRKVIIEDGVAKGVEYEYNGEIQTVFANKEVILSAGAVNSPKLLMLSGVGPTAHLTDMGIETKVDLAGVGQNMHDHVFTFLQWRRGEVANSMAPLIDPTQMVQYLQTQTGAFAARTGIDANLLVNLDGDYPDWPDVSIQTSWQATNTFGNTSTLQTAFMNPEFGTYFSNSEFGETFSQLIILLRPRSRGQVILESSDPDVAPIIDHNLYNDLCDVSLLTKGVKKALEYTGQSPLADKGVTFYDEVVPSCADITDRTSDEYYACIGKTFSSAYNHIVGTCRMGPDTDSMSVVDARLNVKGVENLRVVDASIMPDIVVGNTFAAVAAIAEKAADMVKVDNADNKEFCDFIRNLPFGDTLAESFGCL